MVNNKIQLDFTEEGLREKIEVVQGDTGRILLCNIIGVDMTGVSARFYAVKDSGKEIYNNCKVSKNTVLIELTEQTLAEAGIVKCQLDLRKGNQKVQSFIFNINVTPSLMMQSEYLSSSEYKVVDDLAGEVQENKNKIAELDSKKANKDDYGSPLQANTVAEMIDKKKVYVYVGTESGYIAGNWYTWNGSAWVSGGVYNSAAIQTDKTLTQTDKAADAGIVGEQIDLLKKDLENFGLKDNSVTTEKIAEKAVTKDKIALDVFNEAKILTDSSGGRYKIVIKEDESLGLEKVEELFSGKEVVSRVDLTKYNADGNRYSWKDMITGELTYSGQSGWYPLKSFNDNGQSSSFTTTKAYETLLKNTTGEYSFITNATTFFLGSQISTLPISGNWKSNISINTQPGDMLYIWVAIDEMLYLNNLGELKTFSVTKYNTNIMQKDTKGALANQTTNICAVVLLKDGTVRIIYNGTIVAEPKAPADFAKWDFSFYGTQTSVSAGIIATSKLTSGVGKEYIIVNDAVTEQEVIDYYGLYAKDKTTIIAQDYICMNKNDKVTLSYGVTPEIFRDSVIIESDDTSIITVKNNVITAVNEGEARIVLTFANSTYEIVVYVGQELNDTDKSNIEILDDRTINEILFVNEYDFPEIFFPDDEFALYALGIDTTNSIPYKYNDKNMIKFISSDTNVCTVEFGVLHAIAPGEATITISNLDESVTKKITVKVIDEPDPLADYDIYKCNDRQHGIYNNNTNATSTTQGIKAAMDYTVEQGYKKIVFNKGEYAIDPAKCPILIPSDLQVDFNNSQIYTPTTNPTMAYTVFSCHNVKNVRFKNAHVHGENYKGSHFHKEGNILFNIDRACENITVEDSSFTHCPGFNFNLGYGPNWPIIGFKLSNVEAGGISDSGTNDDANTTNRFRSIDFIDISKLPGNDFGLGNMQGYQGYAYMTSRLYNIYFYDTNKAFLSVKKWCVQYQVYEKPVEAKYCKIMFFQENMPTTCDPDYQSIAHIYNIENPKHINITRCRLEQNVSCGLSPQGGRHLVVSDCDFINNGHMDPSSQIDWEDGRIHMQGHIIRRNRFINTTNYACQIVSTASRDISFHDNYIEKCPYKISAEATNTRTWRNIFKKCKVEYNNKTDCVFIGNTYTQEPIFGTPQGGTLMKYNNKLLDN